MRGKVFIVGAGPGDPKLITLKGLEALKSADVVIHDRLIPQELLKEVKQGAEIIYVGKKSYSSKITQEEINKLMIEKAREGKKVVRLKGGDPLVFSRGGEEILALSEAGIDFEIIPGITSAISAPASAFIPLTFRGISSSILITTGKEDPKKQRRFVDFKKIAKAADTIIVLMCVKNLESICRELIRGGLNPETPAAIIENATTDFQRVIEGTLSEIPQKAIKFKVSPPAVLIVGPVVKLRSMILKTKRKIRRILIPRPEYTNNELDKLLAKNGYEPISLYVARAVSTIKISTIREIIKKGFEYAIFTSQISIKILEKCLKKSNLWYDLISSLNNAGVVAIGPATKKSLNSYGIKVDILPNKYSTEGIIEIIRNLNLNSNLKIILFRSFHADNLLEKELKKLANVTTIYTHRLEPTEELKKAVDMILEKDVDALIITSPMMAKILNEELKERGYSLADLSRVIRIFSIGPVTSKALKKLKVANFIEAKNHYSRGIYEAILKNDDTYGFRQWKKGDKSA